MPSDGVVMAANICQSVVPLISLLAYIPQWVKILRARSSASISLRSWCAWTLSSSFALFYAIVQLLLNHRGWALIVSSGVGLLFVISTLILVMKYRPAQPAPTEAVTPQVNA